LPLETLKDKRQVESAVFRLLRQKLNYFEMFACIADLRGQKPGQKAQFKTEKWLQVELVVCLWHLGIRAIPEYGRQRWDLYIPSDSDSQAPCFLALDCLSDSAQSAPRDFSAVKEDLNLALDHDHACVALILPFSLLPGRRKSYRSSMMRCIANYPRVAVLEMREHRLPFEQRAQEGIVLVWIEKKRQGR